MTRCKPLIITAIISSFMALPVCAQENKPLDSIAAVVNDSIITMSYLEATTREITANIRRNGTQVPDQRILQKQVLDNLILEELQLQEAEERGVKIDDKDVDSAMQRLARNNNMSLAMYRKGMVDDGIDYIEFRKDLKKRMTLQAIRQGSIRAHVNISEQEVDDYLALQDSSKPSQAQYLLSHILISTPETATPDETNSAKSKAQDIIARLQKGDDFAKVAIAESDDQNALQGGALGWRQLSQLPTLFSKAVVKLNKGGITPPLQSPSGFHILKLSDIKGEKRHVVKQINARHILIKTNELLNDEQARRKLSDIRERIVQGEDFAALAKVHSDDTVSAADGGNLGWSSPDKYVPQFTKVLTSMPNNKVSEPFKSQFGWHILEVLGHRNYDDTVEFKRDQAYENIFKRKATVEEQLWLRRLRDQAYIDNRLDKKKS